MLHRYSSFFFLNKQIKKMSILLITIIVKVFNKDSRYFLVADHWRHLSILEK